MKHNLLGQRFGALIVISESPPVRKKTFWLCRCDCGNEKPMRADGLTSGRYKSCGCDGGRFKSTHGMYNTPEYRSWVAMKTRCTNPNGDDFHLYGGRGISVCERWLNSFENFYADMGSRPEGTTLDRKDPDGNYEPGNCRWATLAEQNSNRGTCLELTYQGVTYKTLTALARALKLDKYKLQHYYRHCSLPLEEAIARS